MNLRYHAVIFDLDGTLLNTLEDLADSVNYALREFDCPARSIEEVRRFVGNGVHVLMEKAMPADTPNERLESCLACFKEHYKENMRNKTRPYDGVYALLNELKAAGCKMAVVSNKYDAAVKALCRELFADAISVAVGESEKVAKKPSPDGVLQAIKELGCLPEEAVYVGDSEVDVRTAQNAKIACIGVLWGFRDREILEQEGAECLISHPRELTPIVFGEKEY